MCTKIRASLFIPIEPVITYRESRSNTMATARLFSFIRTGNLQAVRGMLEGREDVNVETRGAFQRTPLHQACCACAQFRIAKYLIEEQNANVNAVDRDGWTPLYEACWRDGESTIAMAELLLANGADVNVKVLRGDYGWTALHLACSNGNTQLVQMLLNLGADANAKMGTGVHPLLAHAFVDDQGLR